MKIDIFAHILPPRYKEALKNRTALGDKMQVLEDKIRACPSISDLDVRFRVMDRYEDYVQVLTIVQPPVENMVGPKDAVELARIANDEMAELVAKYQDRFVAAVACLPMSDIDSALEEADRAITELRFRGVQIYTSINGKPLDSPELVRFMRR